MTCTRIACAVALCCACAAWGCAPAARDAAPPGLTASAQTPPSEEVARIAASLRAKDDVASLLSAMRYVGEHLAYDPAGNPRQFDRTAPELYRDKTLGGCSEFALAVLALCRAMGYPARLALTMNSKWVERNRQNPLAVPNGHGFVEVWATRRWLLLDPTYFAVYDCHGQAGPYLPGNEILLERAADFWDAGMTSVDKANAILRQRAADFRGAYVKPACAELGRVDFNYPAAFANLGQVFKERGKPDMAMRLFRKAVELDPAHLPARLGLAECLLAQGQNEQAAEHYRAALKLNPASAEAAAGLARSGR